MSVNGILHKSYQNNTAAVHRYRNGKNRPGQFYSQSRASEEPFPKETGTNTNIQAIYNAYKTANSYSAADTAVTGRNYTDYQSKNYTLKADNENQCVDIYNAEGEKLGAFFYEDLKIRKDQAAGTEILLSSFGTGAGMYNAIVMDEELKTDLRSLMGVDRLETEALSGYKVKTHAGTGIQYILKDGAKGYGGKVLLRNDADAAKYEALAEEYCRNYPNLVQDIERGRIYASFEIFGMAQRTQTGIVMVGHDSISYSDNENGENNWSAMLTGNTWNLLYEWLEKHRGEIEEMQKFQSWQDIFSSIGGSYERIWPDGEERQKA